MTTPDPRGCRTEGANPDWWHSSDPKYRHAARTLCAGCPVRYACLELALADGEPHGIWGGLDEADRAELAKLTGYPKPQIRPPHGHRTRYVGTRNTPGCRCAPCTHAHARYEHLRRTGQLPDKEPLPIAEARAELVTW